MEVHKHNSIKKSRVFSMRAVIHFIVVLALLVPGTALAENPAPISSANGAYIMQVFTGLVMVLVMIFATAWLFRRFGNGNFINNQHMRIVSNLALGAKEKIVVVELGDQQLVLGVTAQSINTLYVMDEPLVDKKAKKEISEFSKKIKDIISRGDVE